LDEVQLEEINDLFGDLFDGSLEGKISDVPKMREVSSKYSDKIKVPGGPSSGRSSGSAGGAGARKTKGGSIPTTEGNSVSTSGWSNLDPLRKFGLLIDKKYEEGSQLLSLKVRFTPTQSGRFNLALLIAGEGQERKVLEQDSPSGPLALGDVIEVVAGEEFVRHVSLSKTTKKIDFGIEGLLIPESVKGSL
jgi:hypothetical protein